MIFSLDVRRARKGDCLLLHFGSKDEPGLAIIDGGPTGVYRPHLRPRLEQIKNKRGKTSIAAGADGNDSLFVDLLMVSHVDDDHIQGILDLTREMLASPHAPLLSVLSFWHNSFDDLIGKKAGTAAAQFGAASMTRDPPESVTDDMDDDEKEAVVDTFKVLASIEQGQRLRGDAEKLEWPNNPEFGGKLIIAGKKEWDVAEGLTFTVAGPMQPEIDQLQEMHDKWLEEQKKKQIEGGAALAAYADKSVPNLSSIVVLARFGGKSMLLTGDARGDKILEGLEKAGPLKPGKKLHVNVLKVPHHGSSNNVEPDFFERITADHYVFSGNGEHGNPERESLQMLFAARREQPFEIHLTYPIKEIDDAREADWKKEQANQKTRKAKKVRADWSPEKQSLAAFFEQNPLAKNQKLYFVAETAPHVIDLLDPLGY